MKFILIVNHTCSPLIVITFFDRKSFQYEGLVRVKTGDGEDGANVPTLLWTQGLITEAIEYRLHLNQILYTE